ncbi:unnamed protein product [Schistosoma mattheei]|uniref:Uncharacterized protein n=1 Tax=Schistosoma mattheei TaxID=31246 RepID=A0A183PPS9_9TREM|nr:unnamed protein product [Schistosoma mattheei]
MLTRNSDTSFLPKVRADDVVQKNDESSTTKLSSSENKTPSKVPKVSAPCSRTNCLDGRNNDCNFGIG